ncbi:hypothetical protein [Rhodococcus sp. JS3073]|uniref:hypothetical protein n=1 Tax=Rhodococcus sp. JS3073 TaxID=3002901 RepID=UPI00228687D0|nr:hypothetical protein [Rhodococcus sp. JS3073]WAM19046.1 hypothetical protein OYT95_41530 [Rhodococcus sp. JS3073]
MSETNMGRVPVGDPIPLRFDPTTKQRLEELAAGIGPRRFGALVRVAARRLLSDPDRVPEALAQARRASADARRIPWAERPLDLDPATSTRLNQLAHEFTPTGARSSASHCTASSPRQDGSGTRCSAKTPAPI